MSPAPQQPPQHLEGAAAAVAAAAAATAQDASSPSRDALFPQQEKMKLQSKIKEYEKLLAEQDELRKKRVTTAAATAATTSAPLPTTATVASTLPQISQNPNVVAEVAKSSQKSPMQRFFSEWMMFQADCFVYGLFAGALYAFINRNRYSASSESAQASVGAAAATTAKAAPAAAAATSISRRQLLTGKMFNYGMKYAFNTLLFGSPFFIIDYALWQAHLARENAEQLLQGELPGSSRVKDVEQHAHHVWHRALAGTVSGAFIGLIGAVRDRSLRGVLPLQGAAAGAVIGTVYHYLRSSMYMLQKQKEAVKQGGYSQVELEAVKQQMEDKELRRSISGLVQSEQSYMDQELSDEKIQEIQKEYQEHLAKQEEYELQRRRELMAQALREAEEEERQAKKQE